MRHFLTPLPSSFDCFPLFPLLHLLWFPLPVVASLASLASMMDAVAQSAALGAGTPLLALTVRVVHSSRNVAARSERNYLCWSEFPTITLSHTTDLSFLSFSFLSAAATSLVAFARAVPETQSTIVSALSMVSDDEHRSLGLKTLRLIIGSYKPNTNIGLDTVRTIVRFFTSSIGSNTSLTSAAKEERAEQERIAELAEQALVSLKTLEEHHSPGLAQLHYLVERNVGPVRFVGVGSTERNISGLGNSSSSADNHAAQHGNRST